MAKSTAEQFRDSLVEVAPGIHVYKRIRETIGEYVAEVVVGPYQGRVVAEEVTVRRRPGGPPVTSEAIRAVPVAKLVRLAAAHPVVVTEEEAGATRYLPADVLTDEIAARLRENGPTTETLEWVAHVYQIALLMGEPPTQTVADKLGIPRSTAGRWIAAAREPHRGLLGPAEQGKAGG